MFNVCPCSYFFPHIILLVLLKSIILFVLLFFFLITTLFFIMTLSAEAWLPLLLVAAPLRRPAGRTTFTPPAAPGGHLGAATLVLRSSVSGGSLARTPHVLLYLWASLPDGVRLAPQVQAQPQGRLSVWCCDTLPPAGHKAHLPRAAPAPQPPQRSTARGGSRSIVVSV